MSLHYQRSGSGDTVVLLHGLFGSLDNLGVIKRGLEEHFDVLSIDLPDHGKSPHSDEFSYNKYAQDVAQVLESNDVLSCTIVGHSMGGKVAMHIALNRPRLVKRLVVADIAPVRYEPRHHNVLNGLNAVPLEKIKSRKEAQEAMEEHIEDPGVIQFLLRSLTKDDNNQFKWRFNLPLLQRDYSKLSEGIEAGPKYEGPTLFIKGGNSDYITADHQNHINDLFPNAKAKIIQGTGHWLHAEKPSIFTKLVKDFIATL